MAGLRLWKFQWTQRRVDTIRLTDFAQRWSDDWLLQPGRPSDSQCKHVAGDHVEEMMLVSEQRGCCDQSAPDAKAGCHPAWCLQHVSLNADDTERDMQRRNEVVVQVQAVGQLEHLGPHSQMGRW